MITIGIVAIIEAIIILLLAICVVKVTNRVHKLEGERKRVALSFQTTKAIGKQKHRANYSSNKVS
jgi:hypothetical protein